MKFLLVNINSGIRYILRGVIVFLIVINLFSCDPALRLKVVNSSNNDIEFTKQDMYPIFIDKYSSDSLNQIIVVGPGDSFTEFYGIGGWWDDSELLMKQHLNSILAIKYSGKFMTKLVLSEFGQSLMTYEINE